MTVIVLLSRSAISASLLPSSVSRIRSTLSRRQASMRISPTEAPYARRQVGQQAPLFSFSAPGLGAGPAYLVLLLLSHRNEIRGGEKEGFRRAPRGGRCSSGRLVRNLVMFLAALVVDRGCCGGDLLDFRDLQVVCQSGLLVFVNSIGPVAARHQVWSGGTRRCDGDSAADSATWALTHAATVPCHKQGPPRGPSGVTLDLPAGAWVLLGG